MSRRLGAAGVVLVLLALVGAGAFGGVFAGDTTGSGLVIEAADGPNGAYADVSDDRLMLDLSEGGGVSNDAVTRLDAVFAVTNDRSYAGPVWISDNSSALRFYDTETGRVIDTREDARNLSVGETLIVGVTVDAREASVEEIESTSGFAVETLVKDATETSSPTGTSGRTATATPTATSSGGGTGGGGGGGGGGSGTAESAYTTHNTTEGATIQVREGLASDPFTADLTADAGSHVSGAGTALTASGYDLTFDRERWRVELTDPTAEPQQAPAVDGEALSYFRADAYQVEASAFDRIGVNASVSVPDGADPSAVAFYRHTADGWQRVETTHRGGERFSADLGGFGEVAVVVESGDGGTGGTTDGSRTSTTSTPTDGGTSTTDSGTNTTESGTDTATSGDSNTTESATAVERLQNPLRLDQGLGAPTVVVFAAFSLWLANRGRRGRGGGRL